MRELHPFATSVIYATAVLVISSGCVADETESTRGVEETPSASGPVPGQVCCTCLVNEGCIDASEYEFCKDNLASGGSVQLSGVRVLSCDEDACVASFECSSMGSSDGGDVSPSADEPTPDEVRPPDRENDVFVIRVEGAEYGGSDLNGADWDVFDQPDPFVSVRIDGVSIGTTSTVIDTYYPAWSDQFVFTLRPSTRLSFRFFDADDVSGDDYGGEFFVQDLAGAIRDGGRSESISGIAVDEIAYTIRPR